jgi:hypothetical protein
LATSTITTKNYYEPLTPFAHYEEYEMARDKAKSSDAMRNRMISLRSGEVITSASPETTRSPTFGRGGRRSGALGRGRQTFHYSSLVTDQEKQSDQNAVLMITIATGSKASTTTKTQTNNVADDDGGTPTISDLTEPTNNDEEDMEEDVDMLQTTLKKAIPSEIKWFTPNTKWIEEMQQGLTKKRYGVEIKITPENSPKENDQLPQNYHPHIFKAISSAILTAARGTSICSIDDDEEIIADLEDIPTSQAIIDHYLESPTINQKNSLVPCSYIHIFYETTIYHYEEWRLHGMAEGPQNIHQRKRPRNNVTN